MARKIMQKNYHLTNKVTGEKIVVHPPGLPGMNKDGKNPKKDGRWIRQFTIIDAGNTKFKGQSEITLYNQPANLPKVTIDNEEWVVEEIPEVKAKRVRAEVEEAAAADATPTPAVDVAPAAPAAEVTIVSDDCEVIHGTADLDQKASE